MRLPKVEKWIAAFGETEGRAAYGFASGRSDARAVPACAKWIAQCYHEPRAVDIKLEAINAAIGGFGIEPIHGQHVDRYHGDIVAVYVNLGDTYTTTVLYETETDRLRIVDWGTWVEGRRDVR
jgi:hypothetical protein